MSEKTAIVIIICLAVCAIAVVVVDHIMEAAP